MKPQFNFGIFQSGRWDLSWFRRVRVTRCLIGFFGSLALVSLLVGLCSSSFQAVGQGPNAAARNDHQRMMERLGIRRLRPGPSADRSAPNPANYEESLAGPSNPLPPLMKFHDGTPVQNRDDWLRRRGELVELFEKEVYGCVPPDVPRVTWHVLQEHEIVVGEVAVRQLLVEGIVDNSKYPEIQVRIPIAVGLPVAPGVPVPVLIMFSPFAGTTSNPFARRFRPSGPLREELILRAGWGYVLLNPTSVQPDTGAGLTRGIIGLTNRGAPRRPEDWGALRAWAWGASRALDFLETLPDVDAKRVAIEGVSRYGKAALVTMAFDTRFAAALVGSPGAGGVKEPLHNSPVLYGTF